MFIFVGPCHLSSTKQCSGDLMFPCEQLVFSVIKVINNPKFVLLRNLYCRYVHLNFFSKTSQCPLKTNVTQKTLNLLYRAAVISQSRCVHLVKLAEVWRKSQQLTFRKSSGSRSTACKVGKKKTKKHLPIEAVHLDGLNYKSEVQIPPCGGRNTIKKCSCMNLLRVFSQPTLLNAAPT